MNFTKFFRSLVRRHIQKQICNFNFRNKSKIKTLSLFSVNFTKFLRSSVIYDTFEQPLLSSPHEAFLLEEKNSKFFSTLSHKLLKIMLTFSYTFFFTHFNSTFHFYTPLKTSENQRFSDIFRGYRNGTLN